jgi:hypothetical protein
MRPDVRTYLIEVARKGQMCTYSKDGMGAE